MSFTITKTPKGKEYLYEVFDQAGNKIGQRKSAREYVACMVQIYNGQAAAMATWFGRPDLIGKGDSRHWFGKPGFYVAHLEKAEA